MRHPPSVESRDMEINHLKDEYADAYENTFHAKRVKKEKEMELALKNMQNKLK